MKKVAFLCGILLIMLAFSLGCRAGEKVIYMYNWSEYMPEEVISQFTKETGIKVNYATYESNEEMYDKLSVTNANGYDIVVPSGYFVSMMVEAGLLRKIDKNRLENYSNLQKNIQGSNSDYAVPYCWGSTLMIVNSNYVDPASITSWSDLLKPEFAGKIVLLDDLRDVFSIALYSLGYSINTRNEKEIQEAYEWLKKLKPSVKEFNSEISGIKSAFINEEVIVGLMYNGVVMQLNVEFSELVAVYPKEGVSLWVDSFVIPKGAKNVDNAYKFIDFLLRPDINKMIVEEFYYSTPNRKTFDLLGSELKNSKVINPTEKEIGVSEFTDFVGDSLQIYEKYWQMLNNY